jgi:acetoin:2,6-dichlorophenolindophenol oxidoreductase subunit beta
VPFDRDGLRASLEKTGRLLITHEAPVRGGFGAEVAAIAAEEMWETLQAPIVRVCGANTPMPYAPELEGFVIPDAARIAQAARSLVAAGVA